MIPFSDVYDDHLDDVYGFFAYRTGSSVDAEDLTQLTFERALRAWSRYDARRASVRTWLLAIALNVLIDDRRRASRSPVRLSLDDLGGREPRGEPVYDLGLDPALSDALTALGPREREAVALRFGADLDGPGVAEVLGVSLANAQQILSRALRKLRAALDGERPAALDAQEGDEQQRSA